MSFVLADRVKETCSAPGTGTVTLLGAATGYQSFSAGIGASNTTYYTIADQSGTNWEVGYGTIGAGGTTLARTTVLASSNSGSLVNFATGSQDVWCDYPAGKAANLDSNNKVSFSGNSYEDFASISTPTYSEGRVWYDSNNHTLAQYNDVTNNTVHLGEEIQLKVYNNTGSTINIGQPVYVLSTSSGFTYPNVALAIANTLTTANVIGLANQAIPTGTAGYVTTIGLVQGVNTGSYTVGDTLYLSPYSAGFYQNTLPPTGYAVKIGTVAYVNASSGAIYVNKSNLSVQAGNIVGTVAVANGGTGLSTTPANGALDIGNGTGFTRTTLTAGTGISITNGSGSISISGSAAGSNTQIQYNNSGAFGASSAFTFDGTTNTSPVQAASNGFFVNPNTNTSSYTIPSGSNAVTAGKFTVATSTTITVSTGSRWVVV